MAPDRSLELLTDAILQRDQPRTAHLFFRMIKREGRSLSDALAVVTEADAPFAPVPSHINVRDGQITLVNNDHTILGLRTSVGPLEIGHNTGVELLHRGTDREARSQR